MSIARDANPKECYTLDIQAPTAETLLSDHQFDLVFMDQYYEDEEGLGSTQEQAIFRSLVSRIRIVRNGFYQRAMLKIH